MSVTENYKTQNSSYTSNVLIVDGTCDTPGIILRVLAQHGIRGIVADDQTKALDRIEKDDYQLIFIAANIDAKRNIYEQLKPALNLLENVKSYRPEMPAVLLASEISGQNNNQLVEAAVIAAKAGFCEMLLTPLDARKLEIILAKYLPNHQVPILAGADEQVHNLFSIVGSSPELTQTIKLSRRIAPTSAPVLVSGESGTGKELISYMIHRHSKRADGPYVRVNCAALSESLLESELFGHEKGAFTGAYAQRKGRFEMAHGGTLLLDEITETPPRFQAKLLRVLEQQDFERVGGNDNIKISVRIISTTNKDLKQEVLENRFRADLYYRLSAVRILVSPLRERKEDIYDLSWHFVNLYAAEVNRTIKKLDPAMMQIFHKYHWPGNVRQLRNVIRTCMILGSGEILSLADVSWLFDELQPRPQQSVEQSELSEQLEDSSLAGVPLAQLERRAILETLRHTQGNQTKAARVLGISDRTLRGKIKQYRQEKLTAV
ncbi:MAG: sigma-54 dependent transcriptional regulator [Phycisphaerae bacterium]